MSWKERRSRIADDLTKILRLDVRFYGRSFAWLSVGHVSGVIRGIATTFLMARWLPKEVLGQFRFILAYFGLAGVFAMSGMSSAVIRGVAKGDTIVARIALKRVLMVAPLGSIALLLAAGERLWHGEAGVAAGMAVAGLAFTPYSVSGFYGSILTGQEKIKELTTIAVTNNLLFAIAFVSVLFFNKSLLAVTLAYFGFDIVIRGFLTVRELQRLPIAGSAADHMSLGNHLSGVNILQTIAAQLDQILVQYFGGYQSLALYSVATVIPEQIKDMVNSLSGTLLQRLSRHEKTEGHVRATRRHFWIAMGGSVMLVLAYAAVTPWALPWLFPKYGDAVIPSIAYAIGLLSMPATVGVYFYQAHQELGRLWRFYLANGILQIGTNLLLIPLFGSWGAIWSRTITRLAGLPLSYPVITKKPDDARSNDQSAAASANPM